MQEAGWSKKRSLTKEVRLNKVNQLGIILVKMLAIGIVLSIVTKLAYPKGGFIIAVLPLLTALIITAVFTYLSYKGLCPRPLLAVAVAIVAGITALVSFVMAVSPIYSSLAAVAVTAISYTGHRCILGA